MQQIAMLLSRILYPQCSPVQCLAGVEDDCAVWIVTCTICLYLRKLKEPSRYKQLVDDLVQRQLRAHTRSVTVRSESPASAAGGEQLLTASGPAAAATATAARSCRLLVSKPVLLSNETVGCLGALEIWCCCNCCCVLSNCCSCAHSCCC